jgi:hypothetical protein
MRITSDDRRFIERQVTRDRYIENLDGMRVFALGGCKSPASIMNAIDRKVRMPERVLIKF